MGFPAPFQGLWMAQLRHCQAGPTDESWLRIEAGRSSFYESSTWLHPLRLRLDGTGQRLELETTGADGTMARVRCPDA